MHSCHTTKWRVSWQVYLCKLVHGGDHVEKYSFVAEDFLCQILLLFSLYLFYFSQKWIGGSTFRMTYVVWPDLQVLKIWLKKSCVINASSVCHWPSTDCTLIIIFIYFRWQQILLLGNSIFIIQFQATEWWNTVNY